MKYIRCVNIFPVSLLFRYEKNLQFHRFWSVDDKQVGIEQIAIATLGDWLKKYAQVF